MPAMTELGLVTARAVEEEARLVMRWRNDARTRAASFHGEEKRWPAFFYEYRGYFEGSPVAPCFGVQGGARVGFLRFRDCADPLAADGSPRRVVDISINVAPESRGLGLGTALIRAGTAFALATADAVLAEVRPGNEASARAFLAAGYARLADGSHEVDGAALPVERYLRTRRHP